MKKLIKFFGWAAGLILVLAIAAIAGFALLFDPNNLRDDITRIVEKETGRQLIIEGELSLTFFPWLGFEVGRTTLGNPEGFSDKLMATVESASASVKLMPLLKRQIEVSEVKFDGVNLNLEVLADGKHNWTDLVESSGRGGAGSGKSSFASEGVNGIHLGNTQISYRNTQSGDLYRVSKLELETGKLLPNKPFSLTASGEVASERDEISGPASIAAEVQFGDNNTIYLRQADIQINAVGNAVPGEKLLLHMQSPLLTVLQEELIIEAPQLQFSGTGNGSPWTTVEGQASGQSLAMALEEGSFTMAAPDIQLNGTSTKDLWAMLGARINGQSLLLIMEQDKNTITIATPTIQMSGTSTGDNWATLKGTVNGPSMRFVSEKFNGKHSENEEKETEKEKAKDQIKNTISIDEPLLQLSATANGQSWATLESGGKGQSLLLEMEALSDTLTIAAPNFQVAATGPGDPWAAMKGSVKGRSLKLVNYDLVDVPAMQINGRVNAKNLPGGFIDIAMTSERLQGSIEHENYAFDVARADLLDLSVFSKKVKASSMVKAPQIEAEIQVSKFSPAKLMKKLGYSEMVTADIAALSSATISGSAFYGPEWMGISNMVGSVDQTAVSGNVKVMASGETRFNIVADAINLDRYREPSKATAGKPVEAAPAGAIEIPTQTIKDLALDGTVKVGKMQLAGIHSSDVAFTVRAAGGDLRINPAQAKLYGGSYNGEIYVNAKGKVPVLSLNERFDNVQFGPFSEDLLGRKRITGTLSGRVTLVGSGTTANQIMGSANGDAVFKFVDGAYLGVDVWHKVRSARALIKGEPQPAELASDRTRFGDLGGTAKIVNGVMRSEDLQAVMPRMKIRGAGNMELVTQKVDFKFVGDVFGGANLTTGDRELIGYPIPIKMTGTLAAPHIGVDMGGLLADLAKRKLLEKIGLGTRAAPGSNTDPNAPAAAEPTVADKVQDLKQKAEGKLKDKLKGVIIPSTTQQPAEQKGVDDKP